MKKIISGILATAMLICMTSCGKKNESSTDNVKPTTNTFSAVKKYSDGEVKGKPMDIWAYYPDETDNGMKLLKECGFNGAFLTRDGEYIMTNPEPIKKAIETAAKYGLETFPYTGHIGLDTDDCLSAEWLKSYDNIGGVYMYDEPTMKELDDIAARAKYFNSNFKNKKFITALFPASHIENKSKWKYNVDYGEYVDAYCKKTFANLDDDGIRIVMADVYPVYKVNGKEIINSAHLYNLAALRETAVKYNAETNLAILTLDHQKYHIPTLNDLYFQINSLLTFGFTGYTVYTFDTRPSTDKEDNRLGMLKDGKTTEIYDRVKKINGEVRAFENIYSAFSACGIIPIKIGEEQTDNYKKLLNAKMYIMSADDTEILSDISSDGDALCGCFKDGDENEAFMIMNYGVPEIEKNINITMTFENCTRAIIYENGIKKDVELTNGVLNYSLDAARCAFVIPYTE